MTTIFNYSVPVDVTEWRFMDQTEVCFGWNYDAGREQLLMLYDKGKRQQWDGAARIDWAHELDPSNPTLLDDRAIPIFDTPIWDRLDDRMKATVRCHHQAFTISQFLHGEQGALIATAKIVQSVPDLDAKTYAATQVIDEARHVEVFTRLLKEKLKLAYPITESLKSVLESGLRDARWDMTYVTMQVLIEGLALAAFQRFRDFSRDRLISSINAYVMQDEARHVAFGRYVLRDYYPQLSSAERRERQQFILDGCREIVKRYDETDVWLRVGLPVKECVAAAHQSLAMSQFRTQLFSRIVPTVRYVGLWSDEMEHGFRALGATTADHRDAEAVLRDDERIGAEFDTGTRQRLAQIVEQLARGRNRSTAP
jgi:hypothetical protein